MKKLLFLLLVLPFKTFAISDTSDVIYSLPEVSVTAVKKPVTIKNDTVIYNAGSFVTGKNAVLKELIKKLPGAEVSTNGSVYVNGKEIVNIYVDGEEFFSGDMSVALENLPTEIIENIQVYTTPGSKLESDRTYININIKPGMKRGLIANLSASHPVDKSLNRTFSTFSNYMQNDTRYTLTYNNTYTEHIYNQWAANKNQLNNVNFSINEQIGGFHINGNARYGKSESVNTDSIANYTTDGWSYTTLSKNRNENNSASSDVTISYRDAYNTISLHPSIQYYTTETKRESLYYNDSINLGDSIRTAKIVGDRLSSTIDFSYTRLFSKIGRTFNLSYGKTISKTHYLQNDTTDVNSNSSTDRINFSYLEPFSIGELELYYNILLDEKEHTGTVAFKSMFFGFNYSLNANIYPKMFNNMGSWLYSLITPSTNISKKLKNGSTVFLNYSLYIQKPTTDQLKDEQYLDENAEWFRGNPTLKTSLSNNASVRYSGHTNKMSYIIDLRGSTVMNDIVSEKIDTVTQYGNVNGNWSGGINGTFNVQLSNSLFINTNTRGMYYYHRYFTHSAETFSISNSIGLNFHQRLFEVGLNVINNHNHYVYTTGNVQNYNIFSLNSNIILDLPYNWVFETDIDYTKEYPMLGASLSKRINKASIKLHGYNLLNREEDSVIDPTTDGYTVTVSKITPRYFMVSFVYNFSYFPHKT